MNKRAIAILGAIFILIVGTLGFIIYQRTRSTQETTDQPQVVDQPTTDIPEETPEEPQDTSGRAVKITDESVVTPVLFFQGNGISYFDQQGRLYKTNLDVSDGTALLSNKQEVVVPAKSGMTRILWPLVGNSYIAEFGRGTARTWSFYNPTIGAYVDLPSQVKSVDWMPTGDKIMFIWVDGAGKATLNISNPDTTGYQTLTDLYEPDNVISVAPDGQNILFYRTQTTDMTKNTINSVSADGKRFASVIKDGYNKGVLWSPDSKKFLYTKYDASTQKYNLWYADVASGETRNLGVATSQTKAVWFKDSQSIAIGVPTSGVADQGVTQDTIYKIDVASNSRQEFSPGVSVDVQEPFLNLDGTMLFFRNAQDNALYYISL